MMGHGSVELNGKCDTAANVIMNCCKFSGFSYKGLYSCQKKMVINFTSYFSLIPPTRVFRKFKGFLFNVQELVKYTNAMYSSVHNYFRRGICSVRSVISSRHGQTFPIVPTLNTCKKKRKEVTRCDGLLYDLLWMVSLNVTEH